MRKAKEHPLMLVQIREDTIAVRPDRQRQLVDATKLVRLKKSIETLGLLHPIVVEAEGPRLFLVVGFRRLMAMRALIAEDKRIRCGDHVVRPGCIPCVYRADLNPFEAQVVELEENLNREELTWQERAQAVARLHRLRQAQDPDWKYSDTLVELGYDDTDNPTYHVRDKLLLADNLDRPEVASAPTEREALKALRRSVHEELLTRLGELDRQPSKHTLRLCDAIEGMKDLPPGSVDVILTDPPYGIQAGSFAFDTKSLHRYDDSWEEVKDLLARFATESFRVARPDAHCYVFCDVRRFVSLATLMQGAGWTVWPRPFIWIKDTGTAPSANYGPLHSYETVLYALKGDKPVAQVSTDVITVPTVKNKEFAAQKPVELYTNLLQRSCVAGDTVLDPFCGSGTIFRAANTMSLTAIGFDNDPLAFAMSKEVL